VSCGHQLTSRLSKNDDTRVVEAAHRRASCRQSRTGARSRGGGGGIERGERGGVEPLMCWQWEVAEAAGIGGGGEFQRKGIRTQERFVMGFALGCVRFWNRGGWNGMVPFLGHGMVSTLCSVRKNSRNGTVLSLCSVLKWDENGME
jgi:hypothetical protein